MGISRASCSEMWGIEETSRGWRIWLICAVFLGLIVNFIAVLGCLSPATQTIHLYKLEQAELLDAIEIVANTSSSKLENDGLPKTWYWGLSGVCDDNNHCQSSFPPTYSLGSMIESSLKHSLSSESDLKAAVSPWYSVIKTASIDGHSKTINPTLHSDRNHFIAFSRASAALAILALLTSATILGLSIASLKFNNRPRLWKLYLATFFDGMLLLGSTILAMYAMMDGPRSIIRYANLEVQDPGKYLGPGMYTLAAGVLIKFMAIGGVFVGLIVFGIVSLIISALAVMCACACLAGAAEPGKYRCPNCGWSSDWRPSNGCCPNC
ncbi:Fc.00g002940.m01.CDS01 [Cosmosporella sp. VM-42]